MSAGVTVVEDGKVDRLPRLGRLLLAFHYGERLRSQLPEHTGFTAGVASKALDNAVHLGYVERSDRRDGLSYYFRLTARGLAKLGAYGALAVQRTPEQTALLAIEASPAGLNSMELAERLGVPMAEVDEMLAQHVAQHRLVSCATWKQVDGQLMAMTLYRSGWADHASFGNVRAPGVVAPQTPAPAPKPAQEPAAEPPPVPPATDLAAPAVADKLVEAVREPAPAAPGPIELPVFECDIDAVHRKLQRGAAVSPAPGQDDLVHDFLAALYSDGVLWVQLEDGRQFDLQPDETRALFRFLDRLAGTALVEALPCA